MLKNPDRGSYWTIWNAIMAIALGIILPVLIFNYTPSVVKLAGAPFLYLPAQLGFIDRVNRGQVAYISLTVRQPNLVEITTSGSYAMYTDDLNLLQTDITAKGALVTLTSMTTGKPIEISRVDRGIRPYDAAAARGRPIYIFEIEQAGLYEITPKFGGAATNFSIVPDYTTGHETLISAFYLMQITLLAVVILGIYYYRHRTAIAQHRTQRRQKRVQLDSWMKANRR